MKDLHTLLKQNGLTQNEFSYLFDLDIRKVQNWCSRGIPDYIYDLFEENISLRNNYSHKITASWKQVLDNDVKMLSCSNCKSRFFKKEYIIAVGIKGFAYCPYCGSKMDNPGQKIISWPYIFDSEGNKVEY